MSGRLARAHAWVGLAVVLYGTICALLVAFVVYRAQSLVSSPIDVNGFGLLSRNLALGNGFSLGYGPTIRRAPLYPFLGAAILKVFGNYSPGVPDAGTYRPILVAQCVVFGFTCLIVWMTAHRLFGARVALVAALLCPLVPQSLRYVGQTEVETVMGFFTVLLAYTGLRLIERPSVPAGIWFGLVAAAATLTKPVTLLYPFFFLLLSWWYSRTARQAQAGMASPPLPHARIMASCAAVVFLILPLVPWAIRDLIVTNGQFKGISSNAPGEFLRGYVLAQPKYYLLREDFGVWDPEANADEEVLLRQHGAVFYHYNSPSAGTMTVVPPIPKGVSSATLDAQKDRIEMAEVKRRLLHEPSGFLRKFVIQLATFWYLVEGRAKSLLVGAVALVVLALAMLGVVRAHRGGIVTWPVVAILVYNNLIYAAILASARYAMPLFPTLLILSANGLATLVPHRVLQARRVPARSQA
jgi:4-amino-4-deoxy-L-arabinose transferase-like glycosyltransferase